jgi:hypothetical protein
LKHLSRAATIFLLAISLSLAAQQKALGYPSASGLYAASIAPPQNLALSLMQRVDVSLYSFGIKYAEPLGFIFLLTTSVSTIAIISGHPLPSDAIMGMVRDSMAPYYPQLFRGVRTKVSDAVASIQIKLAVGEISMVLCFRP